MSTICNIRILPNFNIVTKLFGVWVVNYEVMDLQKCLHTAIIIAIFSFFLLFRNRARNAGRSEKNAGMREVSGAGTIFQQGGRSRPTFSSWGSGGALIKAPAGSGAEPRRQADFDNNLWKIN